MSSQRVLFDAPGPRARRRHLILTLLSAVLVAAGLFLLLRYLYDIGQITPDKWESVFTAATWEQYFIPGILATLRAAAGAIVLSIVLGLLLALGRMSEFLPLRWVCTVFVEFFRAVPVLIMMIFAWQLLIQVDSLFGVIDLTGLSGTQRSFLGVVVGLVCYNSAVIAEVVRSGTASLPSGQREAGLSVGMSSGQVRRSILLPQALTAMLPTLVSQLVVVLKDTALGYIILYPELLNSVRQLSNRFGNALVAFAVGAVLFILINYVITKIAELLEARLRRRGRTAGAVAAAGAPTAAPGVGAPETTVDTRT